MTKKKIIDTASFRTLARFSEISIRDLVVSAGPLLLITAVAIVAAYLYVRPAPPDTITIVSGPPDSVFQRTAGKYQKILARNGVKLRIVPSEGSLENLKKLNDPAVRVDVGFVQGGVSTGIPVDKLVSLGSVFHEPLAVFYRSAVPLDRIYALNGKRLAIGREGSGAHVLSLILLKANGIEPGGATTLLLSGRGRRGEGTDRGKNRRRVPHGGFRRPPDHANAAADGRHSPARFRAGGRLCATFSLFEQAGSPHGGVRFRPEPSAQGYPPDRPDRRACRP